MGDLSVIRCNALLTRATLTIRRLRAGSLADAYVCKTFCCCCPRPFPHSLSTKMNTPEVPLMLFEPLNQRGLYSGGV